MITVIRCGRTGNWARPGVTFRDGERYLVVLDATFKNSYGHPGGTACPRDDCWRTLTVLCREATDEEREAYLVEKREKRARWDAYQARVLERRRAYLARRAERAN